MSAPIASVVVMGDITPLGPQDNGELQQVVVQAVRRAQAADPLAPVTLVVDTAAQAWVLRRQIVESLAVGSGIANLRAMTLQELLADLARRAGVPGPASRDEVRETAVIEAMLRAERGELAASAEHAETSLGLAALADELTWCRMGAEVDALGGEGVSPTARAAIDFVHRVRPTLTRALRTTTWPDAADRICAAVAAGTVPTSDLGALIVVTARIPAPAQAVLDALAQTHDVTRVTLALNEAPIAATVLDFPDPATETAYAVRLAADAIAQGVSPGRVAILYSTDVPYARLLEHSLADAGIAWHGPTGQTLATTSVARCLDALVALTVERTAGGSGMTRPLLMRLLAQGHLQCDGERVEDGRIRRLIRSAGLFGDARKWLGHLDELALAGEVAVSGAGPTGDSDADEVSMGREVRDGESAAALAGLIRSLDATLAPITRAGTWADLGDRLWSAFEAYHLNGRWWQVQPEDRDTVKAVRALLLDDFPGIDGLGAHTPTSSAGDAAEMIERTLVGRRARHGASSVGIHVGPVASSRGLVFEHVILVGASEGLLPPVRGEDPFLPDAARQLLRQQPDDLPLSVEFEGSVGRDVRAVAGSARNCLALYSRGALPGRAVGLPSRYLPGSRAAASDDVNRIPSPRTSLIRGPLPVATADVLERQALAGEVDADDLGRQIAAITAWARPHPGPYFGDLGPVGLWGLNGQRLSASAIEQFLHCPYHFFVQRILGISTDEYEDVVDTVAPNDLGTLLHDAFERLVNESLANGTLPGPGEPWPDSALTELQRIVDDEVARAQAKGLTGWEPAWQRNYEIILESLAAFLDKDATLREGHATQPIAAERGFGYDDTVEFAVDGDVVVELRGKIDRVDSNADRTRIGVVDYKTGQSKGFAESLGKPKRDGTAREREKVQDLVYDVAARALYPEATEVDVHFMFVPNRGEGPQVVSPTHDADREAVLRDILARLADAGRTGAFLPTPRGSRDYCPVCTRLDRRASIVSSRVDAAAEVGPAIDDEGES